MSDRRAAYHRIERLVGAWLVTAAIVGGCASVKRLSLPERVDEPLALVFWFFFAVAGVFLCIASWRDQRHRGTYLGIVFGTLAEIVVVHRVPQAHWLMLVLLGTATLLAQIAVLRFWLRGEPPAGAPSTASASSDLGQRVLAKEFETLFRRSPAAQASQPADAEPRSGIIAFVASATILLAIDMVVASR
jgi:hypothetical protein